MVMVVFFIYFIGKDFSFSFGLGCFEDFEFVFGWLRGK